MTVIQHAEFKNIYNQLDDRNDGTSRQKVTECILQRFGVLNRDNWEMAVLAERDTNAWNNLKFEEEKSPDLREKVEVERILGKGVEGRDVESEEEEEEEEEEDDDVAGTGLRQWTFWF
jgi:hypothetical protein